jgi:hypothetical protein
MSSVSESATNFNKREKLLLKKKDLISFLSSSVNDDDFNSSRQRTLLSISNARLFYRNMRADHLSVLSVFEQRM